MNYLQKKAIMLKSERKFGNLYAVIVAKKCVLFLKMGKVKKNIISK